MQVRAAVAFEAGKPLEVVDVELDGPKEGEILNNIESLAFSLGMIALILIATAWLWAPAP